MIRSVRDIAKAYEEGRWHTQRFTKNAGTTGDGQWQDWAYASGQPAYDARIGNALVCTPVVATRNDAIYFPGISASHERRLTELRVFTVASGTDQITVEFQGYDLVAIYPLIDGDNTDPQPMDNTLPLPRYADGVGLRAVLVNHIAPAVVNATATIDYTDSDNVSQSMSVTTTVYGTGKAAWTLGATGSAGPLYLPSAGRGIKRVDTVTFPTAPGGLWCIYILRPMANIAFRGGLTGANQSVWTEKSLPVEEAWNLPRVYDGAHLGFFYMPNGSSRSDTIFGTAQFIWG